MGERRPGADGETQPSSHYLTGHDSGEIVNRLPDCPRCSVDRGEISRNTRSIRT